MIAWLMLSQAGNKYAAVQRTRPSQICSDGDSDSFLPKFLLILFLSKEVTPSLPCCTLGL